LQHKDVTHYQASLARKLSTLVRILRKAGFVAKVKQLIDSRNKQAKKDVFRDDYKEVEKNTLSKQMVPGDKSANL